MSDQKNNRISNTNNDNQKNKSSIVEFSVHYYDFNSIIKMLSFCDIMTFFFTKKDIDNMFETTISAIASQNLGKFLIKIMPHYYNNFVCNVDKFVISCNVNFFSKVFKNFAINEKIHVKILSDEFVITQKYEGSEHMFKFPTINESQKIVEIPNEQTFGFGMICDVKDLLNSFSKFQTDSNKFVNFMALSELDEYSKDNSINQRIKMDALSKKIIFESKNYLKKNNLIEFRTDTHILKCIETRVFNERSENDFKINNLHDIQFIKRLLESCNDMYIYTEICINESCIYFKLYNDFSRMHYIQSSIQ